MELKILKKILEPEIPTKKILEPEILTKKKILEPKILTKNSGALNASNNSAAQDLQS